MNPNNALQLRFLVIGAQKAGTSWLHARLRGHPSAFVPEDKDFEFFAYPGGMDEQAFRQRFSSAADGQIVGDVCASYFWTADFGRDNPHFNRDIPGTIRQLLGEDIEIFVMLRDPLVRAISAYLHHIAFGAIPAQTGILDAPGNLGILAMSRYGVHLDHWLAQFPAPRVHVLPSPDEVPGREIYRHFCREMNLLPATASALDDAVVFPGLPRKIDADGLWVDTASLSVPPDDRPLRHSEAGASVQLIDAPTLRAIEDELRDDTARLAGTLEAINAVHPAFRRWRTWPSTV